MFVDSYRSQLTVIGADRTPRHFAYMAGAPNSCVLGADGALYVCQNGGTVGPWRAAEMIAASIQRVREGGKAETLITEVEGVKLNGPNDLCFSPLTAAWCSPTPAPTTRKTRTRATSIGSRPTAPRRW